MWAFAFGTIPVERTRVNRRSADLAADLINQVGALSSFPKVVAHQMVGARSFAAVPPISPSAAVYRSFRCICAASGRSSRRAARAYAPGKVEIRIGDALRSATSTIRPRRRRPPFRRRALRPRSPHLPMKRKPIGGPRDSEPRTGRRHHSAAQKLRRGVVRGASPKVPGPTLRRAGAGSSPGDRSSLSALRTGMNKGAEQMPSPFILDYKEPEGGSDVSCGLMPV